MDDCPRGDAPVSTPAGKQVLTAPVKYIFMDVVGFTRNRSIEAQAEVIDCLNTIVRGQIVASGVAGDHVILLPTGDGICVALLNVEALYDVHLVIALGILGDIEAHNAATTDEMRKFRVRVGINSNVDNLVTDINGSRNVAGTGINFAQRVMSMGDAGQILVGQTVFETLRHREKYINAFRSYSAMAKHNTWLPVYQLVGEYRGLNIEEPSAFVKGDEAEYRLSRHVAFYFAHSIRHRDFLMRQIERPYASFVAMVLLWSLASDSVGYAEATEINPYRPRTWGAGKVSLEEQFEYYINQDFWMSIALSKFIQEHHLARYAKFFDADQATWAFVFINNAGTLKLKVEWPVIWKDFEFEYYGT